MTESKKLHEMDPKDIKIEFAPGCFDNFEGTQEELDELIAEITRMVRSGELQENARAIDFDDPTDDDIEAIEHLMELEARSNKGRTLQ